MSGVGRRAFASDRELDRSKRGQCNGTAKARKVRRMWASAAQNRLTVSRRRARFEREHALVDRAQLARHGLVAKLIGEALAPASAEPPSQIGIARKIGTHWTLGVEVRDHNEIPEYKRWENTAIYLGPVVCYKRSGWFGTLSVMPQIYGANYTGNPDNNPHLELEGHERINIRLIFGFSF